MMLSVVVFHCVLGGGLTWQQSDFMLTHHAGKHHNF